MEYMPLGSVPRAARNPKGHDLALIRRSIQQFGCTSAGILDERTGRLVAGHGRLAALELMYDEDQDPPEGITVGADGLWLVPIVRGWWSRSDAEAEAYVVADNRVGETGGWDDRLLAEVLDDIVDTDPDLLDATGYSSDDLSDLVASMAAPPSLDDLEGHYGDHDAADLWPVLRFKVPPDIKAEFYEITDDAGDDDVNRFMWLLNRAKGAA
jgi:hypothetical protein